MKLALVGRPNVGKSSIFNAICKKRLSIVDPQEGVTIDRIYSTVDFFGTSFEIIDTGGIDKGEDNKLIKEQALVAIEEADVLLQVVDAQIGPTIEDRKIAKFILKSKKKAILVINKIDDSSKEVLVDDFLSLGFLEKIGISALHGYNIETLLETALKDYSKKENITKEFFTKMCFIGASNVGKSTLLNSILNENRSIVKDSLATTRDSIDCEFLFNNKEYLLIDTAGIRKKNREKTSVEKFASIRTQNSMKKAEIGILMVDAEKGLTTQDKKIFSYLKKNQKGILFFVNKCDLIDPKELDSFKKDIIDEVGNYPVLFGSAKTKVGIVDIFCHVDKVKKALDQKIPTPKLNKFIEKCLQKYHPPMVLGKRLRIYYLTQTKNTPPRFSLFINKKTLMVANYKQYLINNLRKEFLFYGVSIEFDLKQKQKTKQR